MAKITLTFDNGPEPDATLRVLDCLASHGVKSTFFVLGRKVAQPAGRALAQRAAAEGHWIGNHTFTHARPLGELDAPTALREFEQAEQALSWLDQPQRLFRPHGGGAIGPHLLHPVIVEKLQAGGYTCVLWNCVPGDWRDPDGWLERAIDDCHSRDWSLVVLHDISPRLTPYLDDFLGRLKREGFELTQEYPADCVPIVRGEVVLPLGTYVTSRT